MSKTILVTGAAGFIGSHTTEALLRRGDRVIGLDNFNHYYDPQRKRLNLEEVRALGGDFELVEGDIRNASLVQNLFEKHAFDAVVHLAALAGVRASVEDPHLYYEVNLTGTLNLLEATRSCGQPQFVFASTSSAYGRTEQIPFLETDSADRPLAPYPASKRSAELLGHTYHHLHGVDFTALRFFTVYGPRGRPDMMAYLVLESMRLGRPVPLYNRGEMYRDWTYVGDTVQGIVAAVDQRLGYEIINLGRGQPVLLKDFIEHLSQLSQKQAVFLDEKMNDADVSTTFANIEKAERLLNYHPRISVQEGVELFYEWYVRNVGPFS